MKTHLVNNFLMNNRRLKSFRGQDHDLDNISRSRSLEFALLLFIFT